MDVSDRSSSNSSRQQVIARVRACAENLAIVQRMLQSNYNFSHLTHNETVKMTTLETLCYRGLFSYHFVIIDKLTECKNIL